MAEGDETRDPVGPVPPEPETAADPAPSSGEPAADRFAVTSYVPPEPAVQFADHRPRSPEERAELTRGRARRRRRRRIIGWSMIAAGVVILGGAAWVGWRSYQAYTHLEAASAAVSTLQDQLSDITAVDSTETSATVQELQSEAAAARSAVDDPVFRAATVVPLLGAEPRRDPRGRPSLSIPWRPRSCRHWSKSRRRCSRLNWHRPTGRSISVRSRASLRCCRTRRPRWTTRTGPNGSDRPDGCRATGGRRGGHVVAQARSGGGRHRTRCQDCSPPAADARISGPRTYLVVFQNPAELRATGGIFGSYAVVQADQGRITIIDQGASSRTLGFFDPPVAELTPEQIDLYSQLMAQYPQDVNFTPDFPTAAPLFSEMYRLRSGNTVDGVLAIDPVALSYLLEGAAPIDVGDGVSITADNLVPILLSTAYQKFDNNGDQSQRDAFLANATAQVFANVMSGKGNPRAILERASEGGRRASGAHLQRESRRAVRHRHHRGLRRDRRRLRPSVDRRVHERRDSGKARLLPEKRSTCDRRGVPAGRPRELKVRVVDELRGAARRAADLCHRTVGGRDELVAANQRAGIRAGRRWRCGCRTRRDGRLVSAGASTIHGKSVRPPSNTAGYVNRYRCHGARAGRWHHCQRCRANPRRDAGRHPVGDIR